MKSGGLAAFLVAFTMTAAAHGEGEPIESAVPVEQSVALEDVVAGQQSQAEELGHMRAVMSMVGQAQAEFASGEGAGQPLAERQSERSGPNNIDPKDPNQPANNLPPTVQVPPQGSDAWHTMNFIASIPGSGPTSGGVTGTIKGPGIVTAIHTIKPGRNGGWTYTIKLPDWPWNSQSAGYNKDGDLVR